MTEFNPDEDLTEAYLAGKAPKRQAERAKTEMAGPDGVEPTPVTPGDEAAAEAKPEIGRDAETRFVRKAQAQINRRPLYYGQMPDSLAKEPKVKLQAKAMYAILHTYCRTKRLTGNVTAEVSMDELEEKTGLSESNIRHWIDELEETGWLHAVRRGRQKVNLYRLYPVSGKAFQAMTAHHRIQHRLNVDSGLARRLRESLYPDGLNSITHARPGMAITGTPA
jgi:DNA-binding transcriptional ArsR family regulator